MLVDRLAVEAGLLLWFLPPACPFSFKGEWNGVATQNTVLATPYYIYSYYCSRLIGSDSGSTGRMGNVNGLRLSMVRYQWGSRSPETACVSAPASLLGGGAPRFRQYDRRREAAAGGAALVSRQWNPPTNVVDNNNMTIRRIYHKSYFPLLLVILFFYRVGVVYVPESYIYTVEDASQG